MADDDLFIKSGFTQALAGARSRQGPGFQGRHGLMAVVVEFDKVGVLRNPDGTFTSMQGRVGAAHARLAEELAQHVAAAQQASMLRPGVTSGRLQKALLHPKNRYADQVGYGVGRPEFLDQSQAKYWRQIDQGYKGHLGRQIRGVWGATLTGEYGGYSRFGPYPIAGPEFTGMGAEGQSGGRLLPFGYSKLRAGMGKERSIKGVITKPIAPQQYFKRGWESFNARSRTTEVIRDEVSAAFGGKGVPTAAYLASMRQGPKGGNPPAPGKRFR